MNKKQMAFRDRVEKNLSIAKRLQQEPWLIDELDRDPGILAALIAYFADYNAERIVGGIQPGSTRQAIQSLVDFENTRRSSWSMGCVSWAGVLVGIAGFALAAIEFWSATIRK